MLPQRAFQDFRDQPGRYRILARQFSHSKIAMEEPYFADHISRQLRTSVLFSLPFGLVALCIHIRYIFRLGTSPQVVRIHTPRVVTGMENIKTITY
jgi:hypothetical protein